MSSRILVAYATYAGSTAEVAAQIGESLTAHGFTVEVRPMSENPKPGEYTAAILGSAVHNGAWLPEALDYVTRYAADLKTIPVALFCVHIQNTGSDAASTQKRLAYLDAVRSQVTPIAEGFFGGRFDRKGARASLPAWLPEWALRLIPTTNLMKPQVVTAWAAALADQLPTAGHPVSIPQPAFSG